MNRTETARILAVISLTHPGRHRPDQTAELVDAWHSLIGDLEYAHVNAALRALLQTSSWAPTPADVRRAALEIARGPGKTGAEAWGWVLRAVSRWGAYRSPGVDFDVPDPVTARVVAALGWQSLCLSENAVADRARFIEAYDAMAQQDRREAQSPVLQVAREHRAVTAGDAIANVLKLAKVPDHE